MNGTKEKCSFLFYLVNCFVIEVVQPEGSRSIYIHTSNLKKEKTGIQLHVSYTYELIRLLYSDRLVCVYTREEEMIFSC